MTDETIETPVEETTRTVNVSMSNVANAFDYLTNAIEQEGFTLSILQEVADLKKSFIKE